MGKSRRKSGAGARGRFKRKNLNKGYSTIHKPHYLVRTPRKKVETPDDTAAEKAAS